MGRRQAAGAGVYQQEIRQDDQIVPPPPDPVPRPQALNSKHPDRPEVRPQRSLGMARTQRHLHRV